MKRGSFIGALIVVLTGAAVASATVALAQDYPSRPITMMVGFPPGGPTDTLARIVADGMKTALGQPIVVEDLTGAGGTIASNNVVHANPDGYTIGIGNWTSHVGAPALYVLQYDVLRDLQPIAYLSGAPLFVLGKSDLPPRNVAELISWVKAKSTPSVFGTVGAGSAAHMCGVFFQQKTGAKFQYVPYRGAAPAMQDLMAGQIDLACLDASSSLPNVQAGRFKAYAVMNEKRWDKAPDIPTMIETGLPDLTISFWHGLWAPKGTPRPIVDRLSAAARTTLADPDVRKRLDVLGQQIATPEQATPEGLAAFQKAEIDKWWPIIRAADIKTE
jgi:tripartite-type tricarboxylate transporter receptor subunit TctC